MNRLEREAGEKGMRRRRFRRGVFMLPSMFTVGNIFCGYFAILATMKGQYDYAAQAIGIAIVLDMLDGRIARLTNTATDFGVQLDSLADVISFGIAPSILVYVWGFSVLTHPVAHRLGWIAAFTFSICGAMRLARFNVQAGRFKHFVGLPIPAAGGAIAAIVHFFGAPINNKAGATVMMAAVFLLSFLMVSTIRYSSMKYLTFGKKSRLVILLFALLLALIYSYSGPTLLAVAVLYSLSGITVRLYNLVRRKGPGERLQLSESLERH